MKENQNIEDLNEEKEQKSFYWPIRKLIGKQVKYKEGDFECEGTLKYEQWHGFMIDDGSGFTVEITPNKLLSIKENVIIDRPEKKRSYKGKKKS